MGLWPSNFGPCGRHVHEDQYLYLDFEEGVLNGIRMVDKETAENSDFVIRPFSASPASFHS